MSDVLMNGTKIRNSPPNKKKITTKVDLSPRLNLCFISTSLSSAKIFKQAWFAISNMSSLIVVNVSVVWLWSFKLATNGWQLQEVGDFGDENCLPALNLIRSTKLHLTTEPPISCRRCYQLAFLSFVYLTYHMNCHCHAFWISCFPIKFIVC